MIAALGELIEAIETFLAGFAGWRYLISACYRERTHERWKKQTYSRVLWDILGGTVGILCTLVPVGILLYLIL